VIPLDLHPPDRTVRGFATLWLPLAALVLGALLWRAGAAPAGLAASAVVVALIAAAGYTRPGLVRPLYVALTVATWPLGLALSTLLLAIVFFGLVTPIGLARRALGRDALGLRPDRSADTYWTDRPPGPEDPERVFRPF
jgi:hypothetical protein